MPSGRSNKRWGGNQLRALRVKLSQMYGPYCWICGQEIEVDKISPDHVVPVSMGGSDEVGNLRPSHLYCNKRRGIRPLAQVRAIPRASRAW